MRGRRFSCHSSGMKRFAIVLLLFTLFVTPAGADEEAIETTLYFGLGLEGGGEVGEAEWRHFLADTVTPRFPDGLTIIPAAGQWRDPKTKDAEIISEPTRIVVIVHPQTSAAARAIVEIRQIYVKRFRQGAVLQTDQRVRIVE